MREGGRRREVEKTRRKYEMKILSIKKKGIIQLRQLILLDTLKIVELMQLWLLLLIIINQHKMDYMLILSLLPNQLKYQL